MLHHSPLSQKGTILVVGMLLLVILTIVGIAALNSTMISEKLTQNLRDTTAAFGAAESALGAGELWLQNQTSVPTAVTTCNTPPCAVWAFGQLGNVYQQGSSWWSSQGTTYPGTINTVAAQPQYVIEQYSFIPAELSPDALSAGRGYYYYRITAQGVGITTNSVAYVQSIYAIEF